MVRANQMFLTCSYHMNIGTGFLTLTLTLTARNSTILMRRLNEQKMTFRPGRRRVHCDIPYPAERRAQTRFVARIEPPRVSPLRLRHATFSTQSRFYQSARYGTSPTRGKCHGFLFVLEERGRVIQMGSLIIETQKHHATAASITFDGSQSLGPIKRLLSCLLLFHTGGCLSGIRGRVAATFIR